MHERRTKYCLSGTRGRDKHRKRGDLANDDESSVAVR
jgi:hypothetical protein